MAVPIPSFRHIVEQVQAANQFKLHTLNGCGELTRASAVPIHKVDKRFVMLKKKASRTHVVDSKGRLHGADVLLFVESPSKAIAIDIIGSSNSPDAKVAWTPERDKTKPGNQFIYRYTAADGFAPDYEVAPEPEPEPEPEEPTVGLAEQVAELRARVASWESWARSFPK
jgi:hypothetical protein